MTDNNNNNQEPVQIAAEPIIAVFKHDSQYYVSTPDTLVDEYYNAVSALLFHIKQDTPQMFEELKTLINVTDVKIN